MTEVLKKQVTEWCQRQTQKKNEKKFDLTADIDRMAEVSIIEVYQV